MSESTRFFCVDLKETCKCWSVSVIARCNHLFVWKQDIDCMPVNSFENLSDSLIRKSILVDGGNRGMEDPKHGAKSWISMSAGLTARASANERLENPASLPVSSSSSSSLLNALCKQARVRLRFSQSVVSIICTVQFILKETHYLDRNTRI